MEVLDLDLLRPEPKVIKLGGKEIDVSFIPCGITFDVDRITREISELGIEAIKKGGEATQKAFTLSMELCAIFCQTKHPEMDEQWFQNNTNPQQVNALVTAIKETLFKGYEQVQGYSKNGEAVKTK